jgi:hypothetical protein
MFVPCVEQWSELCAALLRQLLGPGKRRDLIFRFEGIAIYHARALVNFDDAPLYAAGGY